MHWNGSLVEPAMSHAKVEGERVLLRGAALMVLNHVTEVQR